jgi:hypothetical protein
LCLRQTSHLICLGHHSFCYTPIRHNTASYIIYHFVSSLTNSFGSPCPNNRVQTFIRILSCPMTISSEDLY